MSKRSSENGSKKVEYAVIITLFLVILALIALFLYFGVVAPNIDAVQSPPLILESLLD